MTTPTPSSVVAILTQLIPEVMGIIRSYHTTHNSLPTDQFVIDQLNFDVNRILAISDAWLAANPKVDRLTPFTPTQPTQVISEPIIPAPPLVGKTTKDKK